MADLGGLSLWDRPLQFRLLVGMPRSLRGTVARGGAQQRAGKFFPSPYSTRCCKSQIFSRQSCSSTQPLSQRNSSITERSSFISWHRRASLNQRVARVPDQSPHTYSSHQLRLTAKETAFGKTRPQLCRWPSFHVSRLTFHGFQEGAEKEDREKTRLGAPGLGGWNVGLFQQPASGRIRSRSETCPAQPLLCSVEALGAHPP